MEIRARAALGDLAGEWDALVDRRTLPSPFLRSWWVDHAAIGEPVVVTCLDGGQLVGGLALQRSRRFGVEWLQMLGDGALEPDHLDLVADPGRVTEVRDAIGSWLSRGGPRVLDLRGLVPDADLVACCPGVGQVRELGVCPYVPLPSDFAQYLADRPGKLRSTVTRTGKRFDKAGITTRVRAAAEVDEALDALASLHDDRWGEASEFSSEWESFAAAARAGVAAGEVWFTELVGDDGSVVASEVDLRVGTRLAFYQAGRKTDHELRGSGSVLRARIIERAIEEGCDEFDLLRGDEPYKTEWASASRRLVRIRKGVGARGIAIALAAEANARLEPWREARLLRRGDREQAKAAVEKLETEKERGDG
ncbi:MAG TPA: GNAT family N-acetyltransferase [Microthrixaceae bacterium]|nr:GNAT family N-acetyltransferase [Microthrixaceae bacterium]